MSSHERETRFASSLGAAAGVISLLVAFVAVLLGGLAIFISRRRTGAAGLGVAIVLLFQCLTSFFGGYLVPAGAIARQEPLGRVGRWVNFAAFALTILALILSHERR